MTDCYTSMNHQELINKLKERNNPNELDLANTINTLEKCKFTGYHLLKCLKQGDEYTKKLINYNPEDEEILDQVNIIINRLWIDQMKVKIKHEGRSFTVQLNSTEGETIERLTQHLREILKLVNYLI